MKLRKKYENFKLENAMKEILTAKLVLANENQRYYELSNYINTGIRHGQRVDIHTDIFLMSIPYIDEKYREKLLPYLSDERGTKWICVSDAHTHIERVLFPAIPLGTEGGYIFIPNTIGDVHTPMTCGGDASKVFPEEAYINTIAILNGYEYGGITDTKTENVEPN